RDTSSTLLARATSSHFLQSPNPQEDSTMPIHTANSKRSSAMVATKRQSSAPHAAPNAKRAKFRHDGSTRVKKIYKGEALQRMYESGEWSDLSIKIKDSSKTFTVHKAVLCPAWEYARAACTRGFVETQTSVIELPEDEHVVAAILRHYYELPLELPETDMEAFLIRLRVAIDKYGVGGLIKEIEEEFQICLDAMDYTQCVEVGLAVFEEDGYHMENMRQAAVKAAARDMDDVVRDDEVWAQIQESPEFMRQALIAALPGPPIPADMRGFERGAVKRACDSIEAHEQAKHMRSRQLSGSHMHTTFRRLPSYSFKSLILSSSFHSTTIAFYSQRSTVQHTKMEPPNTSAQKRKRDEEQEKPQQIGLLERLYESEEWTDLEIEGLTKTFRVHKAVVCSNSAWFSKACQPGRFIEGKANRVKFSYSEPVVDAVLQYLYELPVSVLDLENEAGDLDIKQLCKILVELQLAVDFLQLQDKQLKKDIKHAFREAFYKLEDFEDIVEIGAVVFLEPEHLFIKFRETVMHRTIPWVEEIISSESALEHLKRSSEYVEKVVEIRTKQLYYEDGHKAYMQLG
ncbi:hypothetical protein HII31_13113, partial [Pseudocercospora fuligena]